METLPSELWRKVFSYISPLDACSARLVARSFLPFGTERAFSKVVIRNDVANYRARHIFSSDLKKHVRHVFYCSDTDERLPGGRGSVRDPKIFTRDPNVENASPSRFGRTPDPDDVRDVPEAIDNALWGITIKVAHAPVVSDLLKQLPTLPLLSNFTLIFSTELSSDLEEANHEILHEVGYDEYGSMDEATQTLQQRQLILIEVFRALSSCKNIRHLELYYYHDEDNEHLIMSPIFTSVLNRLTGLEIFLCIPDELEEMELDNKLSFPLTWLPHCKNLRTLSIFSHEYWGYEPYADLSKLHFPHLHTLALGGFTFSQPSDITFLTSHASLCSLSLISCPLLIYSGIPAPEGFQVPQDNRLRWKDIFTTLQQKFTNLTSFYTGGLEPPIYSKSRSAEPGSLDLYRLGILYRTHEPTPQPLNLHARPELREWFDNAIIYPRPDEDNEMQLRFTVYFTEDGTYIPGNSVYPDNAEGEEIKGIEDDWGMFSVEDLGTMAKFAAEVARKRGVAEGHEGDEGLFLPEEWRLEIEELYEAIEWGREMEGGMRVLQELAESESETDEEMPDLV